MRRSKIYACLQLILQHFFIRCAFPKDETVSLSINSVDTRSSPLVPSNKQFTPTDKRHRRTDSKFQFLVGGVHPVKFTTQQLKQAGQGCQSPSTAQRKDESNK